MNPLRVAVIGAGHLGRIHARLAAALEGVKLVAVADPVEAARTAVAQEANTRSVADYHELIGKIDAAIIATPTTYHHAVGMELLHAGIPLLIEKPIALNSAQGTDLVNLARQKGLALQVGHVERFNPALDAIAADIHDPKYIEGTRTSGYTFRSTDVSVVMDMMIHDIDIVLALVKSEIVDVRAMGFSVLGGTEDMATAHLTFASGCVAQLTTSRVSFQQRRTMSIFTGQCSAAINFATFEASVVRPSDEVLQRKFCVEKLSAEERAYWKEHVFDKLLIRSTRDTKAVNAIQEEQRDFVKAIRTGRSPRVDGAAGRDAVAVAEMILDRIADHAWDGTPTGRRGALAMPTHPAIAGTTVADRPELRRAG